MEFEIRLSGSVEVVAGGRRHDLGPAKTRLALAALAWDAGHTVSVDTLIHRIWDEHPPAKSREALHAHVSRIRAALRSAAGRAPEIVNGTNSYALHVDPDRVDLRCYTKWVERARTLGDTAGAGDDGEAALRLLDRAAGLWRGEPLAGIAGSWPEHLRTTVGETNLAAAMTRAEILLERGRFTAAVSVLLPLADQHPMDEALVERLAVALHGSDRTAEATRLLQRTRQQVARDTGLDTGRGLHRVHHGILSGAPAATLLRSAGAQEQQTKPPAPRVPDNLPRDVPWVGRHEEVRRLTSALCESPATSAVVTVESIDGMGGVGKTSLAVHVGHRLRGSFPDGCVFLHLGDRVSDSTGNASQRALAELLRLLGMDANELPREEAELEALWSSAARDRRMLVILDDAVTTDQVRPLLPGASPTAILVTSRRRLSGLPGVRPLALDVLPEGDAAALFVQRLGTHRVADDSDVREIARICGHLPLAIEIAASRLLAHPSWSASDLLGELSGSTDQLGQLRDGERSMTHVFAWSYRSLNTEQQLTFRRAGLHMGLEFGPAAVAALTGTSVDTAARLLEELLAHSLVSEGSPHRYRMHSLLRDYARTLCEAEGADAEKASRQAELNLVDHYLRAADRADRLARPFRARIDLSSTELQASTCPEFDDAHAAERWLSMESANLMDALYWLDAHGGERQLALFVHVLAGLMEAEGNLATAEPLLRRAVAHWDVTGDRGARARALLDVSALCTSSSRYEEGLAAARSALDDARAIGDTELESECVHQLSIPLWQTGQYRIAQSLTRDSLQLILQTGNVLRAARSRNLLGVTHLHLAEYSEARNCFMLALIEFSRIKNARGVYATENNLAELCKKTGDLQAAEKFYRQAILGADVAGSKRERATLQMNLAGVLLELGRAEEALAVYGQVLPVLREVGDRRAEAITLNRTGGAHRAAGRADEALPLHAAALVLARSIHATGEEVDVLYELGLTHHAAGRAEQAVAAFEASLRLSEELEAPAEQARAVRALAEVRRGAGRSRAVGDTG